MLGARRVQLVGVVGPLLVFVTLSGGGLYGDTQLAHSVPNPLIPNAEMEVLVHGEGFVPGMQWSSGGTQLTGDVLTECLAVIGIPGGLVGGNTFSIGATKPDGSVVSPIDIPVVGLPTDPGDLVARFSEIMSELNAAIYHCAAHEVLHAEEGLRFVDLHQVRARIANDAVGALHQLHTQAESFIRAEFHLFSSALPRGHRGTYQEQLATTAEQTRRSISTTVAGGIRDVNTKRDQAAESYFTVIKGNAGFSVAEDDGNGGLKGTRLDLPTEITVDGDTITWAIDPGKAGDPIQVGNPLKVPAGPVELRIFNFVPDQGFVVRKPVGAEGEEKQFGDLKFIIVDGDCKNFSSRQYTRTQTLTYYCNGGRKFESEPLASNDSDGPGIGWLGDPLVEGHTDPVSATDPAKPLPRDGEPPYPPFGDSKNTHVDAPSMNNPWELPVTKNEGAEVRRIIVRHDYLALFLCDDKVVYRYTYGYMLVIDYGCDDPEVNKETAASIEGMKVVPIKPSEDNSPDEPPAMQQIRLGITPLGMIGGGSWSDRK